jgi:hypothetical protein
LLISHLNWLLPTDKAFTFVLKEAGAAIVPVPETRVQIPVPTDGLFPVRIAEGDEIQTVWSAPANAVDGKASTNTIIVSCDEAQTPLLIVHTKTLDPTAVPATLLEGDEGVKIVPEPENLAQIPFPITGLFAFSVVPPAEIQIF